MKGKAVSPFLRGRIHSLYHYTYWILNENVFKLVCVNVQHLHGNDCNNVPVR